MKNRTVLWLRITALAMLVSASGVAAIMRELVAESDVYGAKVASDIGLVLSGIAILYGLFLLYQAAVLNDKHH